MERLAEVKGKSSLIKTLKREKYLYILILPCILYFLVFAYVPMIWNLAAFEKYNISKGLFGSRWIGLDNFIRFFNSPYAGRVISNTFIISFMDLVLGFPVPIVFALLINEVQKSSIKRTVQTITYLPHFISVVVLVSMMRIMMGSPDSIANQIVVAFGGEPIKFFSDAGLYRWMYVLSGIWQKFGWDSIIYFAAIASVNPELYEAAFADGAGRWRKMWHVTLPCIAPTIMTLLILRVGWLLSVGFEKTLLLYNEATYVTGDVISTYIYRAGLLDMDFSYGTAIGFFNCVANAILILSANWLSKRVGEYSLF